jgi:YfiH family protein
VTGPLVETIRPPVDGPSAAAFTTRRGGASHGPYAEANLGANVGDRPQDVRENRRRLCTTLGIDPDLVVAGTQIHGATVRRVEGTDGAGRFLQPTYRWTDGDGLISDVPGQALAVFGADCLPVLLWRRDRSRVAAVHAGWRGVVAGILDVAVMELGSADRVGAAIGPGIGPCCYPVSDEVRTRFARSFGDGVVAGRAVDLSAAATAALVRAGIPAGAIWRLDTCTSCDGERWFSHRRDGTPTGRQAGLIWVTERARGTPGSSRSVGDLPPSDDAHP